MNTLLDVINLLKRFGIYIYTGNQKRDIEMMQSEVKDLFDNGLLEKKDYVSALLVLRKEHASR